MAIPMGLGKLGGPNIFFKRKYRWTFEIGSPCGGNNRVEPHLVKLASRPNLTIEETEINYLHGKTWIPGKASWETITVTFYDVANDGGGGITSLYSWLATVYDFTDPINLRQSSARGNGIGSGGYAGVGYLKLYDGCGTILEGWELNDLWPQSVNFGDLDFASSEEVTIELTLRYSQVAYRNYCGSQPTACCIGC